MKTSNTERNVIARKVIANDMLAMLPELEMTLAKFKGKKVFTVNGTKTKAFADAVDTIISPYHTQQRRIYLKLSYKSVELQFSYWHSFGMTEGGCQDGNYYEESFYLDSVDYDTRQVLVVDTNHSEMIKEKCANILNTNYEEVLAVQQHIKALQTELDELKWSIPHYAREVR